MYGACVVLAGAVVRVCVCVPVLRQSPLSNPPVLQAIRAVDSEDEDTVITLGGSGGAPFDAEAQGERLVRGSPRHGKKGGWVGQTPQHTTCQGNQNVPAILYCAYATAVTET